MSVGFRVFFQPSGKIPGIVTKIIVRRLPILLLLLLLLLFAKCEILIVCKVSQ